VCGGSTKGQSADIRSTNDALCAFRLEGTITVGDYEKFFLLIRRNLDQLKELDTRIRTICLKSDGGSYDEALKIADLIYNHGISTLIEYDSQCMSACAIIFMAGVSSSDGLKPIMPYRRLSAGGKLGFHAPYTSISDGNYSKEHVEAATQAMRVAILGLARLSSRQTWLSSSDFLKKSLIVQVLEKGPKEVSFVKTIAEAARWDIEIYDAADWFLEPSNVDAVKNVCMNFHYANIDEPVPIARDLSLKVESYPSNFHKDDDFRILVIDNMTHPYDPLCEVYPRTMRGDPGVHFWACSYDFWSHKAFGDCREYKTAFLFGKFVPQFFTLNPDTVLKSVP
jgi:hypothetical protein